MVIKRKIGLVAGHKLGLVAINYGYCETGSNRAQKASQLSMMI